MKEKLEQVIPYSRPTQGTATLNLYIFGNAGVGALRWFTRDPVTKNDNALVTFCRENDVGLYPVLYPGREGSKLPRELSVMAIAELVADCIDYRAPYILMGFSKGAWVMTSCLCEILKRKETAPQAILINGLLPPTLGLQNSLGRRITSEMNDTELCEYFSRYGSENIPKMWEISEALCRLDSDRLDEFLTKCDMKNYRNQLNTFKGDVSLWRAPIDSGVPDAEEGRRTWAHLFSSTELKTKDMEIRKSIVEHAWICNVNFNDVFDELLVPWIDEQLLAAIY